MSEEEGKDNPLPNLIHREALGIKYNSRKSGGGALRWLCVKEGTLCNEPESEGVGLYRSTALNLYP